MPEGCQMALVQRLMNSFEGIQKLLQAQKSAYTRAGPERDMPQICSGVRRQLVQHALRT